jgi:hypothetical protein
MSSLQFEILKINNYWIYSIELWRKFVFSVLDLKKNGSSKKPTFYLKGRFLIFFFF